MSRHHSHVNTAVSILREYRGGEPLASFLKKFFSGQKKYGSRDRRQISHLCYCYFRLGRAYLQLPVSERVLVALFLCSDTPNEVLENLEPGWNDQTSLDLSAKFMYINKEKGFSESVSNCFPWAGELSPGIDAVEWGRSLFVQPDLFLRLRPGFEEKVKSRMAAQHIPFREPMPGAIALPGNQSVSDWVELNKEAVVQDFSSQRVEEVMKQGLSILPPGPGLQVWDCCAASGGKSIMLYDLRPDLNLTVSDIRKSILVNLAARFAAAGIEGYQSYTIDLGSPSPLPFHRAFSMIIADVPCTGSGTWSRTPEQLFFFESEKIREYAALQVTILSKVLPSLGAGGVLLYCTCSVFRQENEEQVDYMCQKMGMQLLSSGLITGYGQRADTMFAALLKKA